MSFLSKGKEKEKQFSGLFEGVTFSKDEADMNEHWDLKLEIKFDVKGLKKISRNDAYTNEFYHFIELKNVNGKLGWLYGEANYFSFETNEFWVIVKKEALQEFVKSKVSKTKVFNVDESLYCLYTRSDRKDAITMVKTIDLMSIATEIMKKETNIVEHEIGDSIIEEKRVNKRMLEIFENK